MEKTPFGGCSVQRGGEGGGRNLYSKISLKFGPQLAPEALTMYVIDNANIKNYSVYSEFFPKPLQCNLNKLQRRLAFSKISSTGVSYAINHFPTCDLPRIVTFA
jgi:hypothetical protein